MRGVLIDRSRRALEECVRIQEKKLYETEAATSERWTMILPQWKQGMEQTRRGGSSCWMSEGLNSKGDAPRRTSAMRYDAVAMAIAGICAKEGSCSSLYLLNLFLMSCQSAFASSRIFAVASRSLENTPDSLRDAMRLLISLR